MKRADFMNLWPSIKDKEVYLKYGYQSPTSQRIKMTEITDFGKGEVYIKTADNKCLYMRAIREITVIK